MNFPNFSELVKTSKRNSAGGILFDKNLNIVLVQEIDGSWSMPKGGIDEGETPLDAAIREIQEETGINSLYPIRSLGRYYRPTRKGKKRIVFMYLFQVENQPLKPKDRKNPQAGFFPFDKAASKLPSYDSDFLRSNKNLIQSYIK
jgi:ADP-ribose pyrophosphatase YjhB (NUDIX family)